MGRHAIAAELLRYENPEKIFIHKGWYQYLYNTMCDPDRFESFGRSNVSFVTFNYDRSLEYYLYSALKSSFQKNAVECLNNFEAIPIIHVHGQLAPTPTGFVWPDYGTQITPDLVRFAAERIRIIHETNERTSEFQAAQGRLRDAERICFLGFGYHHVNLRRLLKDITVLDGKEIYCGGYGLTEKEKQYVEIQFQGRKIKWGNSGHECLTFLREEGILLD